MNKYYLTNGYASGNVFEASLEEAIAIAIRDSKSMCTPNWLNQLGKGELGRTYHTGPLTWEFRSYDTPEVKAIMEQLNNH